MTTTFFDHWREAPEGTWRWPNFSPAEIACRGTGKTVDQRTGRLTKLCRRCATGWVSR